VRSGSKATLIGRKPLPLSFYLESCQMLSIFPPAVLNDRKKIGILHVRQQRAVG
jgi:hypothetical protein